MYATGAFLPFSKNAHGACVVEFVVAGHPPILYFSTAQSVVLRLGDGSVLVAPNRFFDRLVVQRYTFCPSTAERASCVDRQFSRL